MNIPNQLDSSKEVIVLRDLIDKFQKVSPQLWDAIFIALNAADASLGDGIIKQETGLFQIELASNTKAIANQEDKNV